MRRLLALTAGLSLIALGAAAWLGAGRDASPSPAGPRPKRRAAHADNAPEDCAQILGTWQDRYKGRRTMTLRDDGTAAMVCELEGLNARLFTPVLHLDLRWQLEDGLLKKEIVGGEPADKVQFVINLMGARAEEKLLTLTDTELHLLDADGETEYHWKRISD